MAKKDLKKNNPTSKRAYRRRLKQVNGAAKPHIDNKGKEAKLKTYADLTSYYAVFLKETEQEARFTNWLSKVIDEPNPNKYTFKKRVLVLINFLFK